VKQQNIYREKFRQS